MSKEAPIELDSGRQSFVALPAWRRFLRGGESGFVVLALVLMMLLPCAEIVLRTFLDSGIPSSAPIVQHLVLVLGMLGGALAARDNRLLSISTLTHYLKGHWKQGALVFSQSFAAAIAVFLSVASVQFVLASRQLGKILAYGIPLWVVQGVLAVGFALIACRLVWHAGAAWRGKLVALALACGWVALAFWLPIDPEQLRLPALIALLIAAFLGAPVFTVLGGAALILFWSASEPIAVMPLNHYRLTVNPTLPSIPLFTLAGYFLAEGGAARRFVNLFHALFGGVRGGPAMVTVLVCAFFTSFTGASGVTILALGGLLMPVLLAAGYTEKNSIGLLTGAGSLGLLFPPCLPPILYSIVASTSSPMSVTMQEVFLGGLIPGLLLLALAGLWGLKAGPRVRAETRRFDGRAARRAIWEAKWELLVPVVALVSLFGGFATPVEAAALTAFYAMLVETFVYRDLKLFRDVPRVMAECGLLIGGVILILGVALGFTHYLIDAQIPDAAVEWVTAHIESKLLFLLAVNLFLILVGCLMDIYSAIVVVVPLLAPVAVAFGIDPVHLGIIFLANLELGFLTPPVGMNLFLSSYRFDKPLLSVARATFPMLLVLALGVLLITYFPALTTWLPNLLISGR